MTSREPWNPFDTSEKICFPNIYEALLSEPGTDTGREIVVDIDQLARHHAADIDVQHPPEHGYLDPNLSNWLELTCQAWFNEQKRIKAARVCCAGSK